MEGVSDLLLAVAAVVLVVWVLVRDTLREREGHQSAQVQWSPGWEDAVAVGTEIGDSLAQVKIVEFLDLECPACALYQRQVADGLTSRGSSGASFVIVHFPLRIHPNATNAARAAECAAEAGVFKEFVDTALANQRELGVVRWSLLAARAGVSDTVAFNACFRDARSLERVTRGRALGERLGVRATPTIMVNGWLFSNPPTREQIFEQARIRPKRGVR